jgi:hypothetical protein
MTNKTTKGTFYACNVRSESAINIRTRGVEVTNISDSKFVTRKTEYSNIHRFWIGQETIWYLPKGIDKFFPNLNNLAVDNCELKEITQDDLKVFPKLVRLELNHNDIKVLQKDLFKFNPKIYYIKLSRNEINFIDAKVFDNLNSLDIVDLELNRCMSDKYIGNQIVEMKKVIADKCQKIVKNLEKVEKKVTETKRGKYFWILLICGIIVGLFLIFLGGICAHAAYKTRH